LSNTDIARLSNECARLLDRMKARFTRHYGLAAPLAADDPDADEPLSDLDDAFSATDDETDSDFEAMIADLQNDGDEHAFLQFIEHMQQQGIEIQMGSDEEDEDDEDFVDAEEGDAEWVDAEDDLEEHDADLD
ncbi:hypothetical protein N0V87_010359, partial [Didymella glomerata]